MKDTLLPSLAALATQPAVFIAASSGPALVAGDKPSLADLPALSAYVLAVAAFHLVLLGLPGFYLLQKFGKPSWMSMAILGALVGSIVAGIFSWPAGHGSGHSYSATWHGEFTPLVVDGSVTPEGWLNYLEGISYFRLQGLIGAVAFFAVWRKHAA